jgi:hypothetical protein
MKVEITKRSVLSIKREVETCIEEMLERDVTKEDLKVDITDSKAYSGGYSTK